MDREPRPEDGPSLAVARAAARLLRAADLREALEEILPPIAEAAGADRIHVHRVAPHPMTGAPAGTEVAAWAADGAAPTPKLVDGPLVACGSWRDPLARGVPVQGTRRELPASEAALMASRGAVSALAVPILREGSLVGVLALDDCRCERTWEPSIVASLEALAACVGAAWERERARREERRAEATLRAELEAERRVTSGLAGLGHALVSSLPDADLPNRVCAWAADLLRCDGAYALLLQEGEECYALSGCRGLGAEAAETGPVLRIPAAQARELCPETRAADVQVGSEAPPLLRQLGVARPPTFFVHIPLQRGARRSGILTAFRHRPASPLSAAERRLARGIGQLASLALEHARLIREHDRAGRLKSEFVATMSHELRTPLNVILGYLDLLADGTFGPLEPEQRHAVERAGGSARHLLELVGATLDLGRIEAGRERIDLHPFRLDALLDAIHSRARDAIREKPLALEVEVEPSAQWIQSDRRKLDIVVGNLVGNAVKFTDSGTVEVRARRAGAGVEIRVRDTGPGIPPEEIPLVFEPFHRAKDGGDAPDGAGLGLHIVRRLLDLLGGTIDVESAPGEGTDFRVWIPDGAA